MDAVFEAVAISAVRSDALAPQRSYDILDVLPAAVYVTDASGRITYYNEAAVEFWGHRPELGKNEWCGSWKLYWPDGRPMPHNECPMAVALRTRVPIRGLEAIAERPDGTRVPFIPYPTPLLNDVGVLIGGVNMLVDITGRKQIEAALRQSEARLRGIVSQAMAGIAETDLTGRFVWANQRYCEMLGYSEAEMYRLRKQDVTHPADLPRNMKLFEKLAQDGEEFTMEKRYLRKDGTILWVNNTVSPLRDRDGNLINAVAVSVDITDRKRAEEQQKLLLREMGHRVKNMLAMAAGVVSLTARTAESVAEMAKAVRRRLDALAKTNELVRPTVNDDGEAIYHDTTLDAIIGAIMAPYNGGDADGDCVAANGPMLLIGGAAATSLALVLHELATNAVKYGALSVPKGLLLIDWSVENDDLVLTWAERGGPPLKGPPETEGFGTTLSRVSVTQQLRGRFQVDWRPEGVVACLSVPVANLKA